MAQLIIQGGQKLKGTVKISGMKNATTPILAATLLTKQKCLISNVPRILDVLKMLELLKSLNVQVDWLGQNQVQICAKNAQLKNLNTDLVCSLRSSVLLLGPLLARFGQVQMPEPGGCIIGNRPLDAHLTGLQGLGASFRRHPHYFVLQTKKLAGQEIILPEFSVTATENILMAACLAQGQTIIKLAASEPHVQDLAKFLNKMGAKIKGIGTHTLTIIGVKKLHGAKHALIPDQIEIITYALAGALTKSRLKIKPIIKEHLDIILLKFKQIGINYKINKNTLEILPSRRLQAFQYQSLPYPGLPTDLQAPFGVLATQCQGTSLIHDPMFEGRMGYIAELIKMGANAIMADPHRAIISGPTPLYGTAIKSLDLRAGATLILAGLIAQGQTIIDQAEIIDRGYEDIAGKLEKIGAKVIRKNNN